MDIRVVGSGGGRGWPEPGCGCASCRRAGVPGAARRPGLVLVDGVLEIAAGQPPRAGAGPGRGHQVRPAGAGWDITGPDGQRLLLAAGPGAEPVPPDRAARYDAVLLDLLAGPAQLGALRGRGLAGPGTVAAALYADHRVTSAAELQRRCALWGAIAPADGLRLAIPGCAPAPAPPRDRTLILGGARSGKSREAELRLAGEPRVTYLAAGPWPQPAAGGADPAAGARAVTEPPADAEWASRVAAHRAGRSARWRTVESTDVPGLLRDETDALLIDGIGTWLAAVLAECGAYREPAGAALARVAARVEELAAAWRQARARVVAVSDQAGGGVVPATRAGRLFRDQLGWLNQRMAAEADECVLVTAGRVTALPC